MQALTDALGWQVSDAALVLAGFGVAWVAATLGAVIKYFVGATDGKAPKFDV